VVNGQKRSHMDPLSREFLCQTFTELFCPVAHRNDAIFLGGEVDDSSDSDDNFPAQAPSSDDDDDDDDNANAEGEDAEGSGEEGEEEETSDEDDDDEEEDEDEDNAEFIMNMSDEVCDFFAPYGLELCVDLSGFASALSGKSANNAG